MDGGGVFLFDFILKLNEYISETCLQVLREMDEVLQKIFFILSEKS